MIARARSDMRAQPANWAVAGGVAIAFHVAAIAWLAQFGATFTGGGFTRTVASTQPADPPDLPRGCVSDAMLAATARFALCFGPWHADVDGCLDGSTNDMWIDLSSCLAQNDKAIAEVAMLEPKQAERIKSIDPEPLLEAAKPPEPEPPKVPIEPAPPAPTPPPAAMPDRAHKLQVVETVKPTQEVAPDRTSFLSEYDTSVAHQTVARGTAKEEMIAQSKPGELTPKDNPQDAHVEQHTEQVPARQSKAPDVPGSLAMRAPGVAHPAEVPQEERIRGVANGATDVPGMDGYIARRGDGWVSAPKRDPSEAAPGQGGAGGGAPDAPALKPSQEVLERALGGGNVDYMENVESGEQTALSSKKWIYATFFNRMKRQVAQNWDPAAVWRRDDPTGQVYGYKTRVTELRVSLSATGAIAKVIVVNPSGIDDLDQEAVRAFSAAAPFPNPPEALAGRDHLLTFGFSFFFEIGHVTTAWHL